MVKMHKKTILVSLFFIVFILLISTAIFLSTLAQKNKKNDYKIPFNYYSTSINSEYKKYKELIYACDSNNSVIVYYTNGKITNIIENINEYDEILLESFDVLDTEKTIIENRIHEDGYSMDDIIYKSKAYYVENRKAIPVRIIAIKISDSSINNSDYVCINLCTGEEMDSSIVKEIYS